MGFVQNYLPNNFVTHHVGTANTNWQQVYTGGGTTGAKFPLYDSTAGFGLDIAGFAGLLRARSENGSGADGSGFYIAFNQASAPGNDDLGQLVSGAGQIVDFPGPFKSVWIRKLTAADEIILQLWY